jgi:hypothetical protein
MYLHTGSATPIIMSDHEPPRDFGRKLGPVPLTIQSSGLGGVHPTHYSELSVSAPHGNQGEGCRERAKPRKHRERCEKIGALTIFN